MLLNLVMNKDERGLYGNYEMAELIMQKLKVILCNLNFNTPCYEGTAHIK